MAALLRLRPACAGGRGGPVGAAHKALVHEDAINEMQVAFRRHHADRLGSGQCDAMTGLTFIDIVDNLEKIGDHLTNVAQGVVGGLQWIAEEKASDPPSAPLNADADRSAPATGAGRAQP